MSHFDYETIVQRALRGAVKESLEMVRDHGFSGSHHFYITFQTNRNDVTIPDFLREKHPEEITIVLQHQFWDLIVTDTEFSVSLSFNDKHECLRVPYGAIVSFLDPSVKFGLQFVPDEAPALNADVTPLKTKEGAGTGNATPSDTTPSTDKPVDNVVTMDQFRKK